MYIAHISDLHFIKNHFVTNSYARKVIDTINDFEVLPKFVVVTGDLVDKANLDDYELCFSELNRLKVPYYVIGGNHDRVSILKNALEKYYPIHPKSEMKDYLQYSVDVDDVRLIAVDFYGDRQEGYQTDMARLDWLKDKLEATIEDKKVVIMMHRYPIKTYLHYFAKDENEWHEKLAEVIGLHKNKVKLIVCGHLHNSLIGNIENVPVISTLSSYSLLNMDFQRCEPKLQDKVILGFHNHLIDNGIITSYLVNIGEVDFSDN